ncbi:hypothetical protein [Streptomyces sp. NPDC049879]|uniref:hypothetical protein n=1 Tax=Streptomyces sp. NPDC049879 TaxID=3365598 RepID=UPI0037ACA454
MWAVWAATADGPDDLVRSHERDVAERERDDYQARFPQFGELTVAPYPLPIPRKANKKDKSRKRKK